MKSFSSKVAPQVGANEKTSRTSGFVTNEWLIVAGILAVIVGVTFALPGKWGAIVGIPLLGLFGLSLFMARLDDPGRIVKKLKFQNVHSNRLAIAVEPGLPFSRDEDCFCASFERGSDR